MDEQRSKLDDRRESIEELDLQGDELDAEARLIRKRREVDRLSRGDEPPPQEQGSSLGDKLVEQVVIPMVNDRLTGNDRRGRSDDVTLKALTMLEKERNKGGRGDPKPQTSVMDEVSKAITIVNELRGLSGDSELNKRLDKIEASLKDGPVKKGAVDQIKEIATVLETVKDTFNLTGAGGNGDSAALIAHERWAKEYESKEKTRERAWGLRLRQLDKKHDLDLAKLNIERERNELLDQGIKRIGEAFIEGLMDDDEFEVETPSRSEKGKLSEVMCPTEGCDTMLTLPPEAQKPGVEIGCPVCKSTFITTEV